MSAHTGLTPPARTVHHALPVLMAVIATILAVMALHGTSILPAPAAGAVTSTAAGASPYQPVSPAAPCHGQCPVGCDDDDAGCPTAMPAQDPAALPAAPASAAAYPASSLPPYERTAGRRAAPPSLLALSISRT